MQKTTISKRLTIAILSVLLLVPSTYAGDFGENRFLVGGFVGGSVFDLREEFDSFGRGFDDEVVLGGRFEYRFMPHLGVEGTVGFSPATALPFAQGSSTEFLRPDADSWDFHGNLVYHILPTSRVDPFVTGGIGSRVLNIEGGRTEGFFSGNLGGGALIWLSRNVALRGDTRFYVYNMKNLNSRSSEVLGLPADFSKNVWDTQIMGGVTFAF